MKKSNSKNKELKGIGGWLIFPLIGLFFGIIELLSELSDLINLPSRNEDIASPIIGLDFFFLILMIICLRKFLEKSYDTPRWMIWKSIYSIFYTGIILLIMFSNHLDSGGSVIILFGQIISSIVWILYFLNSERVKNTFINGKQTIKKNYVITLLLSIFLGLFGADRFYLGKFGTGLLKLTTFGYMGIWWIIDIILIARRYKFEGIDWE